MTLNCTSDCSCSTVLDSFNFIMDISIMLVIGNIAIINTRSYILNHYLIEKLTILDHDDDHKDVSPAKNLAIDSKPLRRSFINVSNKNGSKKSLLELHILIGDISEEWPLSNTHWKLFFRKLSKTLISHFLTCYPNGFKFI